ncbi:alpha/beta fold hydrolase [Gordonia shandongensis]|uniref:alpha/beta fold hydrolase n=1 Tax=Gordonia shandongensis TaxID=376351 RepID=UPI0003F73DED|nr:alpha/beta hydrolase [Gordonia shandongensis]
MSRHESAPEPEFVESPAGARIAATRTGEGPAVFLSAGLGMPAGAWQFSGLPDALRDAGFSVITHTARGLAPSSAPPPPYSIEQLAADARAVLAHFAVDDAILVGYSMGCYVTQALATSWPGVRATAMLGGLRSSSIGELVGRMQLDLLDRLGEIPEPVAMFEQLTTTLHPSMLTDDATVRAWRTMTTRGESVWASPDGRRGQIEASYDWIVRGEPTVDRLAGIDVPTLVVAYENDVFFPPAGGRRAAGEMADARFHVVEGLAHGGLMLDADRRASALLVDFCREVVTPTR